MTIISKFFFNNNINLYFKFYIINILVSILKKLIDIYK